MIGFASEEPICSRAGCRELASWSILWRNPCIHTSERRKTWLACDAHVDYLRDFLAARDFPLEVVAGAPAADGGSGS